jgi:hypothetical protein
MNHGSSHLVVSVNRFNFHCQVVVVVRVLVLVVVVLQVYLPLWVVSFLVRFASEVLEPSLKLLWLLPSLILTSNAICITRAAVIGLPGFGITRA